MQQQQTMGIQGDHLVISNVQVQNGEHTHFPFFIYFQVNISRLIKLKLPTSQLDVRKPDEVKYLKNQEKETSFPVIHFFLKITNG